MKRKKGLRCMLAAFVVMTALIVGKSTAEARTKTDKLTLYTGEKISYSYIGLGNVKKVTSSKKSVVAAKKYKGGSYMTAKKAGKANVTVKGSRGKWIHKITVRKPNFKTSVSPTPEGDFLVSVKNNNPSWFDWVEVVFTFRDAAGNPVTERTATMWRVGPKMTAVGTIYAPVYNENVDYSKTTWELSWDRDVDAKYTNYAKKVKFSENRVGNSLYVTAKTKKKYKGKGWIYIGYDVKFYDANGQVIKVENYYCSLYSGEQSDKTEIYCPSDAVSYSITKRVVEKK